MLLPLLLRMRLSHPRLYGNQTLGQKISAIYLAAFERAASADEVAYWEASGFNAAQIGFALVNGAQNDDKTTVTKKLTYSTEFVKALDPAGTGVGPFEFVYDDPALGRSLMDPITKDSTVTTATVTSDVTTNLPQLNPVTLSSGQDNVVGTKDVEVIEASLVERLLPSIETMLSTEEAETILSTLLLMTASC